MQTDPGSCHRHPTRQSLWRGIVFTLLTIVSVGTVQAQDEVLQYAGGERDVEPLVVVADTTISAQLVRDLAENFVQVESIAEIGESPLGLELSDSDREAIRQADLVVYQGLGLMPEFIQAAEQRDEGDRVVLTDRIPDFRLIEDDAGNVNPHTYLSPALLQFAVDHLTTRLKKRLESVAGEIEGNRLRVNIELQSLERETEGLMEDVPRGERLLVTDNDVFAYFAKGYYFQLLDVTKEADSKKAIEQINRNQTPNVFRVAGVGDGAIKSWLESHRGEDIPESVGMAEELNGLWLGDANLPTGTYIGLFRQNVSSILLGLKPLPAAGQESPELAE
ncbi:zinc ABC transporter substrate-binding protein [Guyparkeria hydrothermalis]|uniref:metal ABC transporter substrate-binding protein n=1 Tax=Guyparkeria hydrothermalis TaxID=923 RepID=UPI0020217FE2|nr:zinc ABC transporter substrate-binding protein [Guyparkeria hydrothermalis]